MSLSSNTSSCIKLAVWIISIISAKRLCSLVSSLVIKSIVKILVLYNISRSIFQQIKLQGPHFKPTISAVALDTRNTKAGLILFPPAPKICSAADIKTGFSAPTIYKKKKSSEEKRVQNKMRKSEHVYTTWHSKHLKLIRGKWIGASPLLKALTTIERHHDCIKDTEDNIAINGSFSDADSQFNVI